MKHWSGCEVKAFKVTYRKNGSLLKRGVSRIVVARNSWFDSHDYDGWIPFVWRFVGRGTDVIAAASGYMDVFDYQEPDDEWFDVLPARAPKPGEFMVWITGSGEWSFWPDTPEGMLGLAAELASLNGFVLTWEIVES